MPELKTLPCPLCGDAPIVNAYSGHVICCKIVVDNVDAWNSLPRRPDYNDVDCAGCPERRRGYLTWTAEPPKVAGWYWWRDVSHKGEATTLYMPQPQVERIKTYPGEEWAGPIPAPLEPDES